MNTPAVIAGVKKTFAVIDAMSPEELAAEVEQFAKENPERVEFFREIFGDIKDSFALGTRPFQTPPYPPQGGDL